MTSSQDDAVRQAIADFCESLPFLDEELSDADCRRALGDVVEAARAGTDLRRPLCALLQRISPGYPLDEHADPLIEVLRQLGVPHRRRDRGPSGGVPQLPLAGPPHTIVQFFECPAERCDRHWLRVPGDPIPKCAVEGKWLRERA